MNIFIYWYGVMIRRLCNTYSIISKIITSCDHFACPFYELSFCDHDGIWMRLHDGVYVVCIERGFVMLEVRNIQS